MRTIFLIQQNSKHATELLAVGHLISELRLKGTFDFSGTAINNGLK